MLKKILIWWYESRIKNIDEEISDAILCLDGRDSDWYILDDIDEMIALRRKHSERLAEITGPLNEREG